MYEDCCYNRESQEGTERDTTILHSQALQQVAYSAIFLGHHSVDSVVFYCVWLYWWCVHNYDADFNDILSALVALGLLNAVCFALHLFFIRKNLKKLQGKKKASRSANYIQHRTHRTTVYTSKGISETCNTVSPLVNESEEDTRYLLRKSNQST